MFFCTEKCALSEQNTLILLRSTGQTILLNGVPLASEESITRQHQAHQVTLCTAAGEYARIACRVSNLLTQPLD